MDKRTIDKVALDGVWYQQTGTGRDSWLIASTRPGYEGMLPADANPPEEELQALAGKGIYLARKPVRVPKLAVMCCGQGSVWPGMGRELYDRFPAARAAMDRLAACSNWDVLALMDERDVETIGQTRWQQPYLFLLEYAQWSLYVNMGLRPDCICGHSLGELIALCLSGVYSPEVGWYIMETRSRHMQDLEEKSRRETGMMAVYAGMDVVRELQADWPDLYISNYNTPEQFILSGPRDVLVEARRVLRRKRIPAVVLNITLAFHHPSMRVLRDLDWRRLMSLEMHAPATTMLSCVTAEPYPDRQDQICSSIMDLDENSVRWMQCVDALWNHHDVRHFLELGPADTLCGMVERNEPSALCLSSSLRGHETEVVRRTLARLYTLGHLPHGSLSAPAGRDAGDAFPAAGDPAQEQVAGEKTGTHEGTEKVRGLPALRELLARASGIDVGRLRGSMDLRFDLALRSSCFPALVEEAQQLFGREVSFEDLLGVSTVSDLEHLFAGGELAVDDEEVRAPMGRPVRRPCLALCTPLQDGTTRFGELPCNPCARALVPSQDLRVALFGSMDSVFSGLVRSLASWKASFALSHGLAQTARTIRGMGGKVVREDAPLSGLLGEACDLLLWQGTRSEFEALLSLCDTKLCGRVILVDRGERSPGELAGLAERCSGRGIATTALVMDPNIDFSDPCVGDELASLVLSGRTGTFCWKWVEKEDGGDVALLEQPLLDDADASPFVFPERHPNFSRLVPRQVFAAQISPELFPSLKDLPADGDGTVPVPLGLLLEAQIEAAMLARPGLDATGFTDIRVYDEGRARQGIVREARMVADIRPWLRHDGLPSRMCCVTTSFREVNAQGRRSPRYRDLVESNVMLAGIVPSIEPLWQDVSGPGRALAPASWYDAQGIGPRFRLVADLALGEDHCLSGRLASEAFLALDGVWQYNDLSCPRPGGANGRGLRVCTLAVEAVTQAAGMAFAFDPPGSACAGHPSLVGFVRFGRAAAEHPLLLALRRCWDRDGVVRFEAQVTNARGECLVTVNHLEYNALPRTGSPPQRTADPLPSLRQRQVTCG